MTPQEIFDYKLKWMPGYTVPIHSDLRSEGVKWCKKLDHHEWNHTKYTDVYEDSFYFESKNIGQQFEEEFYKWVRKQ